MKIDLHPAYVLHVRPYRDSSGLIELLTHEYGRISLIAKGYRKSKTPLKSMLQPFRKLLVSWAGKGELKTLINTEEVHTGQAMISGSHLISGLYINELFVRLTHQNDPSPELFDLYEDTLRQLSDGKEIEKTLRIFEKRFLDALGYGLQLASTLEGDDVQENITYRYRIEQGPVFASGAGTSEPEVSGKSLLSLYNETLEGEEALREVKSLMRYVISFYLGGKPLESRRLYLDLKKYTG